MFCNYAELIPVSVFLSFIRPLSVFDDLPPQVELTGINLYDVREKCMHPPLCYDFSRLEALAKDPTFMKALGVEGHACNDNE